MSPPGWVAVGITVAVMASAMATIVFSLVRPDLMLVEHVVFEGQHRSTVQSLRHLSDVHEGTRVWEVDLGETANALERHPWVKKARVHRVWPDQLRVELEEHEPTAVLVYEGLFAIDHRGAVIAPVTGMVLDLPLLTGVSEVDGTVHPQLPRLALETQLMLLNAFEMREELLDLNVSEIAYSSHDGLVVHVGEAEVWFGHGNLNQQLDRLAQLVHRGVIDLERQAVYIDLAPQAGALVRART
jgi:cell division protein FtsQ